MLAAGLRPFEVERYYERWEFVVRHDISASDVEPLTRSELLSLADPEVREMWRDLSLGYTRPRGHPMLREEIARLYELATADDVLVFAGAEEGILLTIASLVAPHDHVVVVTPAYQSLHEIARSLGARITSVPLKASEGWQLDPEKVTRAFRQTTRALVMNFPNNPTGALLEIESFRWLAAECMKRGIHLFSDEVYRGVEQRREQRLPAAVDLDGSHVSLGVMSKAYGLAGLRIGWIACRDRAVVQTVAGLKHYTTICSSAPSEILAIGALRAGDRLLNRSRSIIAGNLARLDEFAASHRDHVRLIRPTAGTTALVAFPSRDMDSFCRILARERGVLLLPGSVFGLPPEFARIGLGRRRFDAGLGILGNCLRSG